MIIDKDGNITIFTQERLSIPELISEMNRLKNTFKNDNVIVNLTTLKSVSIDQLIEFLTISNHHRSTKHSFVIVSETVNIDDIPDEIIVVPSLQEAYDIIEMEEMERDLGF